MKRASIPAGRSLGSSSISPTPVVKAITTLRRTRRLRGCLELRHRFDPLRAPGGRLPWVHDVDGLVHDLLTVHLPDADRILRSAVVVADVPFVDPRVAGERCAPDLHRNLGRINGAERMDVRFASDPFAPLWEFQDRVFRVDRLDLYLIDTGVPEVLRDQFLHPGFVHRPSSLDGNLEPEATLRERATT